MLRKYSLFYFGVSNGIRRLYAYARTRTRTYVHLAKWLVFPGAREPKVIFEKMNNEVRIVLLRVCMYVVSSVHMFERSFK